MNQLSLDCGDTNECQDEFWSLYIHSKFSVYYTICHVPRSSGRVLIDQPFLVAHGRSRSTKAV